MVNRRAFLSGMTALASVPATLRAQVVNCAGQALLDRPDSEARVMLAQLVRQPCGPPADLDLSFFGPTLDPRVTFTRASTGSYFNSSGVLSSAASGAPRFDYDPITLQPRGLLLEEARTNLCTFSTAINSWAGKNDTVVTDNNSASPDGTVSASLCTEGTLNTAAIICPTATVATGATITGSAFFKRGNNDWIRFIVADPTLNNGAAAWINTSTGALGTVAVRGTGTNPVGSIQAIRNGWYRLILTCTLPAGTTTSVVAATSASADNSSTRVNNATYLLWGAQLEQNAFPTSYIPTTGAAATRAIETAIASGLSLPAANGASLAVDAFALQNTVAGTNCNWAMADDGTAANVYSLLTPASSGNVRYNLTVGSVALVSGADTTTGVRPVIFKAAESFNKTVLVPAMNGVIGGTAGAVGTLPTLTRMQIGTGGIAPINGYMRRVRYWSRALTNNELQQVTT